MKSSSNPAPDPAPIRAQLRRILASPEFAASERMRRFLHLAVSETIAGRGDDLKEYRFGVEVFDRPESFNPATDPIVRVEARRLRAKLAKYYETGGRSDDTIIELPKGGYVPCFRKRERAVGQKATAGSTRFAVLPFANLTGSADGAYIADGLTWELIHGLTRVRDLTVVAWNPSTQLRSQQPEISVVRETLRVSSVLIGSVRKFGDSLRVVAQLIDADSGVYLWSETIERRLEHAADIQREISEAIIATLQIRLAAAEPRVCESTAYNAEAYRLYLQGRGQWDRRTAAGIRDALESFRTAAELEPAFAAAHAGMADAYTLLAEYALDEPDKVMPLAKASALRALAIDPSLGEAHCSLGLIAGTHEWNWEAAEAHFRQALYLNPGYATTHHWFACDFLAVFGRFEEALKELDIALALDPMSLIIAEGKSFLFLLQRDYAEAETQLRAILESNPAFYKAYTSLGRVYIQMGRYHDAIEMLERGRSLAGDLPTILGAMGQAYGRSGQVEKGREILALLETMRGRQYAPATTLALTHLGLEQHNLAIAWLEEGLDRRESNVVLLRVHPAYDELRANPAFDGLVKRLGLAR